MNPGDNVNGLVVLRAMHRKDLPTIILSRGSVLHFNPATGCRGAIVNAANECCLGGGGVDGAITVAGGSALAKDRYKLPVVEKRKRTSVTYGQKVEIEPVDEQHNSERIPPSSHQMMGSVALEAIRCSTGSAVITGPGDYGALHVPYVVHAVGPDFWNVDNINEAYTKLQSAYTWSLNLAMEHKIEQIAFSLLSVGVFRGRERIFDILKSSLHAVVDWRPFALVGQTTERNLRWTRTSHCQQNFPTEVFICAFTETECDILLQASLELPEFLD